MSPLLLDQLFEQFCKGLGLQKIFQEGTGLIYTHNRTSRQFEVLTASYQQEAKIG